MSGSFFAPVGGAGAEAAQGAAPRSGRTEPPDGVDFLSSLLAALGSRAASGEGAERAGLFSDVAREGDADGADATWGGFGAAQGASVALSGPSQGSEAGGAAAGTGDALVPLSGAGSAGGAASDARSTVAPPATGPVATDDADTAQDVAAVTPQEAPAAAQERPDVDAADRSAERIDPELRERIDRVVERMREEFGYEVTLVEGFRSRARQAHLYAQGRTRPGAITTWTQRSWHTEGLAADLMVDGSYDDRLAYMRMQRIAREEGLKTLGSRDLGHVELPGSFTADRLAEGPAGPSRRFVGVAVPAAPAAVARVAAVATPGQWVTVPSPAEEIPAVPAGVPAPVLGDADLNAPDLRRGPLPVLDVAEGAEPTERVADASADRPARPRSGTAQGGLASATDPLRAAGIQAAGLAARSADDAEAPTGSASGGADAADALPSQSGRSGASPDPGAARPLEGVVGTDALDRVERVREIQELARAAQPNQVSVRFGEDGADRLRVSLLRNAVGAGLDIADPEAATAIRDRVAELYKALDGRGLDLTALSVNGVNTTAQGGGAWTGAGGGEAGPELLRALFAETGREGSGRDRGAPEQGYQQGRNASDRRPRGDQEERN